MSKSITKINAAITKKIKGPFVTTKLLLEGPNANEILIRIIAASICQTDLHTKNEGLCNFPIVLGHEASGIVEKIGNKITEFKVGDHVILSYDYCGKCNQCNLNKPTYCEQHGPLNFSGHRPDGRKTHKTLNSNSPDVYGSFFQQSSFATYAIAHESNTIKVDKSLPLDLLAPLGCGIQTGAGTIFNTLNLKSKDTIAIFGCGGVGLSAIMAANIIGTKNITAIDTNNNRLLAAKEFGATHTILPNKTEDSKTLKNLILSANKENKYNYSLDTTGIPQVLAQATNCCGPLGVTAMIAPNNPGTKVCIEMLDLLPGKSIRGVVQGDSISKVFIPKLIKLWQEGKFPFHKLLTTFNGLDKLESAAQSMTKGEIIKPLIIIDQNYKK